VAGVWLIARTVMVRCSRASALQSLAAAIRASKRRLTLPASSAMSPCLNSTASLRADAVLQKKLFSLPNVTVITKALSTEVTGDGNKVNGLLYKDRTTDETKRIDLDGIFVQNRPVAEHRLAESYGQPLKPG
jgi:hypothetical protein